VAGSKKAARFIIDYLANSVGSSPVEVSIVYFDVPEKDEEMAAKLDFTEDLAKEKLNIGKSKPVRVRQTNVLTTHSGPCLGVSVKKKR
jgi:hypothetical protein